MRIVLDSRPASDPNGIGRPARCLARALRETAGPGEEVLETNRPSTTLRSGASDVFHAPWMDGAMLHSPCPMIVTVHDLTALKRRSELLRSGLRLRLRPLALQRAAGVIAPTEAVARDAVAHLGVDRRRIVVIGEAPDGSMYRRGAAEVAAVRARLGLPERYLVWVGGLRHPDPAKRLGPLAAAPRQMPLVLVGPTGPWAHRLPGVILTGQVDDDELAAIYSGAHALVIASDQEGFGLSAVEALACGTPVVACEGPALREVLGARATFVKANDMPGLIAAAQRARRPAPPPPPWSWEDAARSTWATYRRVVAEARDARGSVLGWRRRPAGGLPQ